MSIVATVYPKVAPDERTTTALTETQRRRKAARGNRHIDDIQLWQERDDRAKKRRDAYDLLALKPVRGDSATALGPGDNGAVKPLDSLGGDTIWLPGDRSDLDRLTEALGTDFIVSNNARLLLPEAPGFTQTAFDTGPQPAEPPDPFGLRYEESEVKRAHSKRVRGRGVVCAVLDTGVDADHDDFNHRRSASEAAINFGFVLSDDWARPPAEGRGFDLFGHGTHICSIIGGSRGVAPQVGMIAAAAPQTRLTSNVVMFGIGLDWLFAQIEAEAQFDRRVILNLSLGFPDVGDPDAPDGDGYHKALETFNAIVDSVVDLDVLVVAAIGNRRDKYVTPGGRPDVLSVGAVAGDLKRLPFSGHVPEDHRPDRTGPRVMGFGQSVVAADRRLARGDKLWVRRSGTSQAAAYVSGIAALYWCQKQDLSALEIATIVEENVLELDDRSIRNGCGLARFNPKWKP